jgi:general secretion pathway protein J
MTQRNAGYTLLEMLVALVVFGLVMAGLAQGFRFGLTAWSAGARNITRPETMAAVDAALVRMIAQALPGSMTGYEGGISFTTRLPKGAGLDGLADVAILLAPNGDLVLRYTPHPPGIPFNPPPSPRVERLVHGVAGLSIAYFVPHTGGVPAWSSSWSGDGLPLLVRIHCRFAGNRSWPDLVVATINPAR